MREKNNIQKKYCVLVYQSDLVTANWFFLTPDNLKHQIWWLKTTNRPPPTSDWGNHSINWSHRTLHIREIDFFFFRILRFLPLSCIFFALILYMRFRNESLSYMFYTLYFLTFNGITYIKKSPIIDGTVIAFHGGYKVGQTIPLNAALLVFSFLFLCIIPYCKDSKKPKV